MKTFYLIFFSFLFISFSIGQNNDCSTALVVCNDPQPSANPMGTGIDDFADPDNQLGCMSPEVSSVWFYFELNSSTPPNAVLGFILNPLGGLGQDYDWALYGPDVKCDNLGAPIRCSSSSAACGFCPQTGMGMGATDLSEGPGTGDGFVKTLNVQAGQGYFLFIENWTQSGIGFNLQFTDEAADYLDCAATPPCSVTAVASNDVTICAGDNPFQLNVTASGGMPPLSFTWDGTNGGTGFLDDPNTEDPYVTIPQNFSGTITYTVTATDGVCEDKDDVKVVVNPKPNVTINPAGIICNNQPPFQMTGTPQNGTWGGIANSTGLIDPFTLSSGVYQVTLDYTNQFGCKNSTSIDVQIAEPAVTFIDPVSAVCIDAKPFVLTATPTGGSWKGSIAKDGTFDPSKYGIGLWPVKYNYVSPEGCKSSDSILIEVVALPDVVITDPGPLCTSEILHNLDVDPKGGVWSGVADPSGAVYPLNLGVGNFKVKYKYTSNEGCIGADSLTISIVAGPNAKLTKTIDICNSTNTGMITTVDLNTLIISGDKTGFWTDDNNSGASGSLPNLDFKNITSGTYQFTYHILSPGGVCPEFLDTVIVNVKDCDCPSVALNTPVVLCNDNTSIDLNNYKITAEVGTWSISSKPTGINPAILNVNTLDINNKDAGKYLIDFNLTTLPPAACPSSATLEIDLNQKPFASLSSSITVCNQVSGTNPNVINLYSLITAGDINGVWVDLENSGAKGNNNNLDFTGVIPGTYTFSYTTSSATLPCKESSYTIDIVVEDCKCPSIKLNSAPSLCNDNSSLNLNTLSNNASPGIWSIKITPAGTNPASLNGFLFNCNNSDPGDYILSYSLTTPPPAGCPSSNDITITVVDAPFANLQTTAKVCNAKNATPNSTVLDFSQFIISGDKTGKWIDKDNSGATGIFPTIDFTGVTPGNYVFEYTTGNAIAPCSNKSYIMTIIVKDCNCPDLSITPTLTLCNDLTSYDLSTLELTTEPGIWSIISIPSGINPAIINGKILSLINSDPGDYKLQFKAVNSPPVGCPDFSEMTLTINKKPNSGNPLPKSNFCIGDKLTVKLSDLINNEDPSGSWSVSSSSNNPGNAFDPLQAKLQIENLNSGNYVFDYQVNGIAPCNNAISTIEIQINPKFIFSAGQNSSLDCSNPTVTIGQNINVPPGYNLKWSGPGISDPSNPTPLIKDPGTYIATVVNSLTGCSSKDSLIISKVGNPITGLELNKADVTCPGFTNGKIEITKINGGTAIYEYSWNGIKSLNPFLDNLGPGNYKIHITDQLGCIYDTSVVVNTGKGVKVDLGPDLIIDQGASFSISALVNVAPNQIDSIIWYPTGCLNCFQIELQAETDISYKVVAVDKNGCRAEDQINITVTPLRRVYIPNVFSPNGDGINDIFYISTGEEVKEISTLQIFNRWGSPVFIKDNFPPNDPHYGWDGIVNGKPENTGVFVYWAVILFKDGSSLNYKGDITVQR